MLTQEENMNNSNRWHYKYSTPNHQKNKRDLRFPPKSTFAMLGKDGQQKGTDLWEKRKTRLPFSPCHFGSHSMVIPSPRGPDLSCSRWRRRYKPGRSFPPYLASEVQKRSNAPVPGKKLATKVNKSRDMPPYVPGVHPPGWRLISS